MTHRVIIIDSSTPELPTSLAASNTTAPSTHNVTIQFHPSDDMTPAQIGHEIARLERLADKIISGTD